MLALLLTLVCGPSAQAFCGTYIGGSDTSLYNEVSQVALVRQGSTTVLSISNDVHGDTDDFALVIPVPEVLEEDQIHVLDPEIFDTLEQYSTPRLVSYECSDFNDWGDGGEAGGGEGGDGGPGDDGGSGGVDVEAEYIVGEYSVVILSATESQSLFTWLTDNGYAVPDSSISVLQDYLDAGSYFLAAQVDESAKIGDGDTLSPLQFRYEAEMYGLPIRIGTLNARDTQDVLIYAINDYYDGSVGISNYAEVTVEDECMWNPDGDETFSEFYADQFQEAYENTEGGVWMLEYAWGQANCDPCTGDPPDATDMVSLGFEFADSDKGIEFFFSRLHVRYAPSEATQDLVLYQSGITSYDQVRYIQYDYYLEDRFEICGVGWAEDPGSCDEWVDTGDSGGGKGEGGSGDNTVDTQDSGDVDGTGDGSREGGDDTGSATESDASCRGCSSARAPVAGMVWLLGLVALRRRSIR